jgi:glycine/D-amino acid oxidase-like deaminating enzyme
MTADPWPIDTDALVIGAGIYGCSTAYFLAKLGIATLLVDAIDIGAEASGANAGNLHLQLSPSTHANKDPDWVRQYAQMLPFFLEAVALWRTLSEELNGDIEVRFAGGIMVAENDDQMRALSEKVALERAQGLRIELLGRSELRALAPYVADRMIGASYCPGEGMANALAAVVALAEGARAAGARVSPHTKVERIEPEAGRWRVRTNRGEITCRRIVIAAGYRSDALAAIVGLHLPITHRAIQIVATEVCTHFLPHLLHHVERRLTLKQVVNGNVLIGGGWSASVDPVFRHPSVLRNSLSGSLWVAQHVVPAIAGLHLIRCWAGRNVYTPDGLPILGAVPGLSGVYLAICNSYGFTLGPLSGLMVAEVIAGRAPSVEAAPFSITRFQSPL